MLNDLSPSFTPPTDVTFIFTTTRASSSHLATREEHGLELGSVEWCRVCRTARLHQLSLGDFCGRRWSALDSDAVQLAKRMRARVVEPTVRKGGPPPLHTRGEGAASFVLIRRGSFAPSLRAFLGATDSATRSRALCLRLATRQVARRPQGALTEALPEQEFFEKERSTGPAQAAGSRNACRLCHNNVQLRDRCNDNMPRLY